MKIALLFPGQGSQYVGMGRAWVETSSVARKVFEKASDVLGLDMQDMCFRGDQERLTMTHNAQPAILTLSYAAFQILRETYDINLEFMAGHSLGEYTALVCAGAISFSDALLIVRERGRLMLEASKDQNGSMYAIRGTNLNTTRIKQICSNCTEHDELVDISNYNSPNEIVISGHTKAIARAVRDLEHLGYIAVQLKVSAPFHSPIMLPAARKLQDFLGAFTFKAPKYPVISNVSAQPYQEHDDLVSMLTAQMTSPVQWEASMRCIDKQDIGAAIELGPKTILKRLMKEISSKVEMYSWDVPEDMERFNDYKSLLEQKARQHFVSRCISLAICTRNNGTSELEYQEGFVEPYRRILDLEQKLQQAGKEPTIEDMKQSLEMVLSTFQAKKITAEEQEEYFIGLLNTRELRQLLVDNYPTIALPGRERILQSI